MLKIFQESILSRYSQCRRRQRLYAKLQSSIRLYRRLTPKRRSHPIE